MSFEIEGRLHKIFDTEQKSGTFQTREFVLEISSGNYPQLIKFQLTQDKCALLDNYVENSSVKVYFDIRGREWNGKYLTNLNAWRLESNNTAAQSTTAPNNSSGGVQNNANSDFPSFDEEPPMPFGDDLPF